MKYEAILFDFDGVLVDSEPVHHLAWNDVLRLFDLELAWEEYARFIGWSDRRMIEHLCSATGGRVTFEMVWERYPAKQQGYRRRMLACQPVSDEMRELIESLADYKLAVVSSSSRDEVLSILEHAEIADRFATIVGSEDVSRHKPDPEPYVTAGRRLGVRRALVIEDSAPGVESGRAAQFEVLRVSGCADAPRAIRERIRCP